jgi:hypothetical protein
MPQNYRVDLDLFKVLLTLMKVYYEKPDIWSSRYGKSQIFEID